MNEEIVKLRVQQLLDEKAHEIVEVSHIENYQEFIFESFWKLYLEKSKRKVKNNYKSFMFSVRKWLILIYMSYELLIINERDLDR